MSGIHIEVYGQGRPLVMLHGWAMHGGVWREFGRQLAGYCQIICVDLPGHGQSAGVEPYTLERLAQTVLQAIPVQAFSLLGWSLGATVALEMSRLSPQRVSALYIVSGNPCFVEAEDWPGVKAEVLAAFVAQLSRDARQTQLRFLALQVNNSSAARRVLQQLKAVMQACPPPSLEILQAGLTILGNSDLRLALRQLACPVHVILGDRDSLIPVGCGKAVQALNPAISLHIIESAGHAPFLSHEQELLEILLAALSHY
ncbi:MAG: pimeloyl-ACP methyl ester esterase BioH [Methylococcales bacterium]|nr:pimeloyl-ACP methyl ester esterase BioH [Methylococcales bacterium]